MTEKEFYQEINKIDGLYLLGPISIFKYSMNKTSLSVKCKRVGEPSIEFIRNDYNGPGDIWIEEQLGDIIKEIRG
jgi:hypothetical protein